jgi:molecular chaperone GrpE
MSERKDKKEDPNEDREELKDRKKAEKEVDETDETAEVPSDEGTAETPEESESTKYLRLAADFQNYKKRTEKERFERYSEGKKDFAADLLPVFDNFERAIAQDLAANADAKFLEGMEMILTQFQDVLSKAGIKEIPATGEAFDPNVHNAVMVEASDQYESGKVTEVLQKGYQLGEKVIRPAMVKVAQ